MAEKKLNIPKMSSNEAAEHANETSSPSELHEIAVHHPEAHGDVIWNKNTSAKTLQHIYSHKGTDAGTKMQIAKHKNAPAKLATETVKNLPHSKRVEYGMKDVLKNPNVPHEVVANRLNRMKKEGMTQLGKKEANEAIAAHKAVSKEHFAEHIGHQDPSVGLEAAKSPHAKREHVEQYLKRKDLEHGHVEGLIHSSPHITGEDLKEIYKKAPKYKKDEEHPYAEGEAGLKEAVVAHKKAPKELIESVINEKPVKGDSRWNNHRISAFQHEGTSKKTLYEHASKGDPDAMYVALHNEDTPTNVLKDIGKHLGKEKSKSKYGMISEMKGALAEHKNASVDTRLEQAKGSTDEARKLLQQKDLKPEVLKQLMQHKNQAVQLEALKHPSVDKDVVKWAQGRKGELGRKAAQHELAGKDVKFERMKKDPRILPDLATSEKSAKTLRQIHELSDNNPDVAEALMKNPKTPADVMDKVVENITQNPEATRADLPKGISEHPNLSPESRQKALELGHGYENEAITADNMRSALDAWKSKGQSNEAAQNPFLSHANMTPELAKDIVSGKYGPVTQANRIHENAMTKDVVDAAMSQRPEFSNPSLIEHVSQSDKISPEELKDYVKSAREFASSSDEDAYSHGYAMLNGLFANPNMPSKELKDRITKGGYAPGEDDTTPPYSASTPEIIKAAIENPSLSEDDLKNVYSRESITGKPGLDEEVSGNIAHEIEKRGLKDHALQHAPLEVVKDLIGRYDVKEDDIAKALNHKNQDTMPLGVLSHLDNNVSDYGMSSISQAGRKRLFDKFITEDYMNSGSDEFEHAFKLAADKTKQDFIKKVGLRPELVSGMSKDQVSKLKIDPADDPSAVYKILQHPGVTEEQKTQAIQHSPDMATKVLKDIVNPKSEGRRKKAMDQGEFDKMAKVALDTNHQPNEEEPSLKNKEREILYRYIAQHTKDKDNVKKMLKDEHLPTYAHSLFENPKVTTKDIDALKNHPALDKMKDQIVNSSKVSVDMLGHLLKEGANPYAVAQHPKAANSKLLKQLIATNDPQVHADLVDNEKVPEEVKEKLLQNEDVMMRVRPDMVPIKRLNEMASDASNLTNLRFAVRNPNADEQTYSNAFESLKETLGDGGYVPADQTIEGADHTKIDASLAMNDLAHQRHLPDEIRMNLIDQHPYLAKQVLGGLHNISDHIAEHALEKYPNDSQIMNRLLRSGAASSPRVFDHLAKNIDLDEDDQTTMHLAGAMDHGKADQESIDALYQRFKEARPPTYQYEGGKDRRLDGDKALVGQIAKYGSEAVQNDMINMPVAHYGLLANKNLSRDNLDRIIGESSSESANGRDTDFMQRLIEHPKMTAKDYDRVWGMHGKTDTAEEVAENLATRKNISPDLAGEVYRINPTNSDILQNPQLPDEDLKAALVNSIEDKDYSNAVRNKKTRLSHIKEALKDHPFAGEGDEKLELYRKFAGNFHAQPEELKEIYNELQDEISSGDGISSYLVKHPRTPPEVVQDMLDKRIIYDEDAEKSPAIGGKIFRENYKPSFPAGLNLDDKNADTAVSVFPHQHKVEDVVSQIPKGGYLDWAEFKKANPGPADNPAVRKLFTSAPKQRLTQEHADQFMQNYPDKKDFHVSYTKWDGMQRHNNKPQLVVQVNNGEQMDQMYRDDPTINGLHQMVKEQQYYSAHPVTPQTIGWARVDTSDPDNWHIDEIQSDYGSGLSQELHRATEDYGDDHLGKYGIEEDQIDPALQKLVSGISGWDQALLNQVKKLAQKHGIKSLTIHSGRSKTDMNKGEGSDVNNKYNKIYNKLPEQNGFEPDVYNNVESASNRSEEWNTLKDKPIWRLWLEKPEEKKAKKSKNKVEKSNAATLEKLLQLRTYVRSHIKA